MRFAVRPIRRMALMANVGELSGSQKGIGGLAFLSGAVVPNLTSTEACSPTQMGKGARPPVQMSAGDVPTCVRRVQGYAHLSRQVQGAFTCANPAVRLCWQRSVLTQACTEAHP